jgi:hypothetical protein
MWAAAVVVAPGAVVQVPVGRAQRLVDSAVRVLVVQHLLREAVALLLEQAPVRVHPVDVPAVPVQRRLSSQLFSVAMARTTT